MVFHNLTLVEQKSGKIESFYPKTDHFGENSVFMQWQTFHGNCFLNRLNSFELIRRLKHGIVNSKISSVSQKNLKRDILKLNFSLKFS